MLSNNGTAVGNLTSTSQVNVSSGCYFVFFFATGTLTFNRVIAGTGEVEKQGAGKVILTAANTYTGRTYVAGGTLQVGNGSSTTATINSTSNVFTEPGSCLRFEPADNIAFTKEISGTGRVEYRGTNERRLTFPNNNT
jgi:autotransporter-associated beta strand protein